MAGNVFRLHRTKMNRQLFDLEIAGVGPAEKQPIQPVQDLEIITPGSAQAATTAREGARSIALVFVQSNCRSTPCSVLRLDPKVRRWACVGYQLGMANESYRKRLATLPEPCPLTKTKRLGISPKPSKVKGHLPPPAAQLTGKREKL